MLFALLDDRSLHADALVRAPGALLEGGRLIDLF